MADDDYEIDISGIPCGRCGHSPLHFRRCDAIGCVDGLVDESDYDPVNFGEGEEFTRCDECFQGIQRWCPKCGWSWDAEQRGEDLSDGCDDED
jgi:hypothetical protein